ncbi:MAG: DUF456 family protein, partial [Halobacteriales archaeon]
MAIPAGVDPFAVLAVALLAVGAVASLLPLAPGWLLSLVGVYGYWWSTNFHAPGGAFVAAATLLVLAAVAVDVLGGAVAAGAAGTSTRVAAVAGVVGLALAVVAGPVGILLGVGATVYAAERRAGGAHRESLRVAGGTLVGML